VPRLVEAGSDVVVDRDSGSVAISPARQFDLQPAAKEAAEKDARDKSIYELHADELNAGAADVLEYQALPE
jgi:hypothetical protein